MGSYVLPSCQTLSVVTLGRTWSLSYFIGEKRIMISASQAVVRVVGILIFKILAV